MSDEQNDIMKSTHPPSPRFTRSQNSKPPLFNGLPPLSPNVVVPPPPRSTFVTTSKPIDGVARETRERIRRPCKEKENRIDAVRHSLKKMVVSVAPSAWALSPGRYPAAGGEGRRRRVLGVFQRRKEGAEGMEEEGHQLRVLVVKLLQWRFVNARAEAAMTANATAENKIFFAWLKITELRNIVAAKRILIQRRKHKLKVIKLLNPQVNLLNRWELLARRHLEAVASLIKVLEGTCIYIPLVEGAKANFVMVHTSIFSSMDMVLAIEAAIKAFYSKAELIKSLLCELVKIIQEEIEGLDELRNTNNLISSLEMHEISLRGSLIQAKKKETASFPNEIKTGLSWRQFHLHYRIF